MTQTPEFEPQIVAFCCLHCAYAAADLAGGSHFQTGNLYANQRVEHVRALLEEIGLESGRVRMVNVSAGMGVQFAERAKEMTESIAALGPNPLRARRAGTAPSDTAMEETN
jgi:coenzyme F420-reducing hydrogenase delta subunit